MAAPSINLALEAIMTEIIYSGENQELLYKSLPYVYVGIRNSDGKYYIGARMAHMHKRRIISEDFGKIYFTSSEELNIISIISIGKLFILGKTLIRYSSLKEI
jgi:hypothetical protein